MGDNRSYGTTNTNANGAGSSYAAEDDALLPKHTRSQGLRHYLGNDVSRKRADIVLLFSYITTGLLDSTAIAVWGSFVSMQTGNTIYLGLGLSNPGGGTRWIRSGLSVLSFCIGSFCFARYHRWYSPRRRWIMVSSVFFQMICIFVAAMIVTLTAKTEIPPQELHWSVLVPIVLVAFQSAGQAVISRALQYASLTSVVLTSIYCDLFSDAKLFAGLTENVERNRRAAAPLLLLVGAVVGGIWSETQIGITGALWTAVALKLIVVVTWILWPAEKEGEN